jgi:hypothetical protein
VLPHLLPVSLKLKMGIAAAVACAGGGGLVVAVSASSSAPPPAVLGAASAGGATPASIASPSGGTSPVASPAGTPVGTSVVAASSVAATAAAQTPKSTATSGAKSPAAASTTKVPGSSVVSPLGSLAPALTSAIPTLAASPSPSPAAVSCPSNQRLTDAEINWLLKEVSKTASSDTKVSAGAITIAAALQPLLGQNLCASQAQPVVNTLCANSAAHQTIDAMTNQLPFLAQLVVGNPCTDQLATVLPELSSFTSTLG